MMSLDPDTKLKLSIVIMFLPHTRPAYCLCGACEGAEVSGSRERPPHAAGPLWVGGGGPLSRGDEKTISDPARVASGTTTTDCDREPRGVYYPGAATESFCSFKKKKNDTRPSVTWTVTSAKLRAEQL